MHFLLFSYVFGHLSHGHKRKCPNDIPVNKFIAPVEFSFAMQPTAVEEMRSPPGVDEPVRSFNSFTVAFNNRLQTRAVLLFAG